MCWLGRLERSLRGRLGPAQQCEPDAWLQQLAHWREAQAMRTQDGRDEHAALRSAPLRGTGPISLLDWSASAYTVLLGALASARHHRIEEPYADWNRSY